MPDIELLPSEVGPSDLAQQQTEAEFREGLEATTGLTLLERLHLTIDALEAVVRKETTLVRAGNVAEVAELQDEKSGLASLYQAQANEVLAQPSLLQGDVNPLRSQLAERTQVLRQVMADNRISINAAKASRYHRIEAVMKALREQLEADSTYTDRGGLATNRPRRRPILNRSYNAKI